MSENLIDVFHARHQGHADRPALLWQGSTVTTLGDLPHHAVITTHLARFKQPKAVHVLENFPRNAMGKIVKTRLREIYAGQFTA
eukprot:gene5602-5661_t